MVCIPCIVIPVLLYIWHRFIQPIVLKFWNPWKQVEADKTKSSDTKSEIASVGDSSTTKSNSVISDEKSADKLSNGEVNIDQVKDKSE